MNNTILVLDIGNTNITFGLYQNKLLLTTFRLQTIVDKTEDEYAILVINTIHYLKLTINDISGMIISSVVADLNQTFEKLATKYFSIEPIFVGPKIKSGIAIKIEQPKSLGPDLLAGAFAAQSKYGNNCLIVDLGTATTMIVVNDKKELIGGSILIGLETSLKSLISNTSALPSVSLQFPDKVICKDTISCIQSGIMYGYTSMIKGMISLIEREYQGQLKVVLTGGHALRIKPYLDDSIIFDDNLVLDGLCELYYKNI